MKFSTLLAALGLPSLLFAQDPQPRNGPKLGLTMSSQTGGGFLDWSGLPKFGPMVGWSFELPVTSQVSVLLEPMYITKGYFYYASLTKVTQRATFGYIEMPLMLKLSTNPDPQGLFLTGGLMYGYWVYSHYYESQDGTVRVDQSMGLPSDNRGQWSVGIGIGHEKGNWMWEVRGQNSFRLFTQLAAYSHNVVFTGSVCWRFPTEKKKKKHSEEDEEDK